MLKYPTDLIVKYSNDKEYRNCLRKLFSMNVNTTWNDVDIKELDDITQDEWLYDSEAANTFLDFVYNKTKDIPLFQELYILAASAMISTDPNIGIAVLLSYDYFVYFHRCLCLFFDKNPSIETITFLETNEFYLFLKNKFGGVETNGL